MDTRQFRLGADSHTVSNEVLGFNLAQDTGTVWLDDITLTHEMLPTGTVVGWGDNMWAEATAPAGLIDVTASPPGSTIASP